MFLYDYNTLYYTSNISNSKNIFKERTSIQDIIDNLGGFSKGAIYHHFKSKEDILVAVTDRMTAESNRLLADIRDRTDLTGKKKLKMIFKESIRRPVQDEIFTVAPNLSNNPRLIFSIFRETIDDAAPNYILPCKTGRYILTYIHTIVRYRKQRK